MSFPAQLKGDGVSGKSDLPALPFIQPGRYRHYKGGEYEVIGVVRHSESLEPMVLYRALYGDSGAWVRPFAMFAELVEHEGSSQARFSLIAPAVDSQQP